MRWLHLAAVLFAIFLIQADLPVWLTTLAVITFATNLIMFLVEIDEDLRDV